MDFQELNTIYGNVGGYDVLAELVGENIGAKKFVEVEVNAVLSSKGAIPNDDYFRDLIGKLQAELDLRGRYKEAENLMKLYEPVTDETSPESSLETKCQELEIDNPKELALAIEALCLYMQE